MKIGIAISTHNRYEVFKACYEKVRQLLPKGAMLVVVDDASDTPVPEATFRFNAQQGIAVTKNKCIELLYNAGCTHIFLLDDDVYPLTTDWCDRYINTGLNHLCFTFDKFSNGRPNGRKMISRSNGITTWHEPCGCMLYLTRECVDKVGGMDPEYGIWGYEHVGYSMRIYNAGLTHKPFMDIDDSTSVIYSYDWDQTTKRSVPVHHRTSLVNRNKSKYESERASKRYIPLVAPENAVLTTYITGAADPQRGECWRPDRSVLDPLISSMKGQRLYILNDCFPESDDGSTAFVRADFPAINPYFARWYAIRDFLSEKGLGKVFCVDATDVEMINNPFPHLSRGAVYTGNEPSRVLNTWLKNHHTHRIYDRLWRQPTASRQLLNAGLIGGYCDSVISYLNDVCAYYDRVGEAIGLTDMAVFNMVGHSGRHKVVHGPQVNTVFKRFDKANKTAWWRHK